MGRLGNRQPALPFGPRSWHRGLIPVAPRVRTFPLAPRRAPASLPEAAAEAPAGWRLAQKLRDTPPMATSPELRKMSIVLRNHAVDSRASADAARARSGALREQSQVARELA